MYVLPTNTLSNAFLPVRAALVGPFVDAEVARDRLALVVEAVAAGGQEAACAAGRR